jgi:hypothetical protein
MDILLGLKDLLYIYKAALLASESFIPKDQSSIVTLLNTSASEVASSVTHCLNHIAITTINTARQHRSFQAPQPVTNLQDLQSCPLPSIPYPVLVRQVSRSSESGSQRHLTKCLDCKTHHIPI